MLEALPPRCPPSRAGHHWYTYRWEVVDAPRDNTLLLPALSDRLHSLLVRAMDFAGNVDPSSANATCRLCAGGFHACECDDKLGGLRTRSF